MKGTFFISAISIKNDTMKQIMLIAKINFSMFLYIIQCNLIVLLRKCIQ